MDVTIRTALLAVLLLSGFKFYAEAHNVTQDYQLIGFEKHESIPVTFPKDICVFKIDEINFAGSLHYGKDKQIEFSLFKYLNGSYEQIFSRQTPLAVDMDCISMDSKAYVALAFNLTENITVIMEGSPIFEVTVNDISAVQFFPAPYQNSIYLRKHAATLYLVQTYQDPKTSASKQCSIYEWNGFHFNHLSQIRCQNAKHLEFFNIDAEKFLMVVNYGKSSGSIRHQNRHAPSILYKFRHNKRKFVEHQKFKTNGAVNGKYFYIDGRNNVREHFIVIANTDGEESTEDELKKGGTPSIFYKYQHGIFVPIQKFHFHHVLEFLPVQTGNRRFVLLVACKNQDMKFLHYDRHQFYTSPVQFTDGVFGKGISKMRTYADGNKTFVVIANERMLENETNVYLPLYQILENRTDAKRELLQRFTVLYQALTRDNVTNAYKTIEKMARNFSRGNINLEHAHIKQAVAQFATLPNRNITKQYWQKIAIIKEAISRLEKRVEALIQRNQALGNGTDEYYDSLYLKNLTVTDRLTAKTINNRSLDSSDGRKNSTILDEDKHVDENVTMKTEFISARQSKEPSFRQNDLGEIRAKQIIIKGTLNGVNFTELEKRILKNSGDQILKVPFNFTKLNVTDLQINGKMNNESPSKLIRITGGNFAINQDIEFTKPLVVNRLEINDRLNHINIVQRELDVLVSNSEDLQVIRGRKIFEKVHLLEPFLIRGKIYSPRLDKVNPVSVINHDLSLHGDYELSGQVFVIKTLAATNFYGESKKRSLSEVFENGLSTNSDLIATPMTFEQPIEANNVQVDFLNELDTKDLIKENSNEQQIITGHKRFIGDVHISKGISEVKTINGINISDLMETRLHKYGDQQISGNLQFSSIFVKNINATNAILLNGTNLNDIITTSKTQSLVHDVTIANLSLRNAKIANVTGWKMIFNQDINYLLKDTVRTGQSAKIFGFKVFNSNLTTNQLIVKNKINDHPVQEFEESLGSVFDDVIVRHDLEIKGDLKVDQLNFNGQLNGIPAEHFGSNWLLIEGDQTFTAPQNFELINAEKIFLNGLINGHNLHDIVSKVYWLNHAEEFSNVTFKNLIAEKDFNVHGPINGLNFAENILLKKSEIPQIISAPISCSGDLIATGVLRNLEVLNNIDISHLQAALRGDISAKLTVDSAVFESYPIFHRLNGVDLPSLLNEIWFDDEDTVISGELKFDAVRMLSHMQLKGPLNGVDLEFLRDHYFSLSKPQQVSTQLIFLNNVEFISSLSGPEITLNGNVVDSKSKRSINITDFAIKTLRNDIDQEITGEWRFFSATVDGDLNGVLINGHRLIDDVLRHDIATVQNITAPKHFLNIKISDVFCNPGSTVNDIDMLNWMQSSAFIYGNYTIQGTITADDIMVRDDVRVLGSVNGIVFDEAFLMLNDIDQVVYGETILQTKFAKENRTLMLSIENLDVESVNKIDIESFFASLTPYRDELKINANLVFKTRPVAKRFYSDRGLFKLNNSTDSPAFYVNTLRRHYSILTESLELEETFLSHFERGPIVSDTIQKIVQLKISTGSSEIENVLVFLRGKRKQQFHITFHRWNSTTKSFDLQNEIFSWHPMGGPILSCDKIHIQDDEILVVESQKHNLYYEHFIASTEEGLQMMFEMIKNQSVKIAPVEYKQRQCLLSSATNQNNLILQCLKIVPKEDIQLSKELVIYTKNVVVQLLPLKGSHFVLLTPNSAEFWNLDLQMGPVGEIALINPSMISYGRFEDEEYLAIATEATGIEIFKSSNKSAYLHIQRINEKPVIDMKFGTITDSADFLLYVLTVDPIAPFTGYMHMGVNGFEKYLNPINLKSAKSFEVITLEEHAKHFVSYIASNETVFFEAVLGKA